MSERKKILFLITKSNFGGAQRYVYDLASALPKDRFEIVVALGGNGALRQKLETAADVRVIPIERLQRDISLKNELMATLEIGRIIKNERPDILHVNSSKAGGLGTVLGRVLLVPRVIFTAHGWAFNEDRPYWQRIIIKFLHWLTVLFSHATITVSEAVRKDMTWPFVQRKMHTVHNGRPAPSFLARDAARSACIAAAPRLDAYKTEVWTGTIAELHPVKRHDIAIDAIAKLVREGHALRHVILGGGELQHELQQQINERGLAEHVFLLGHIDEAARLLPAFDMFILSSRSEALAYVLVEAAQAGLPIVATRVGGVPEILTHEAEGLLVPPHNADALASALQRLIENEALRSSCAANAKKRSEYFSVERMVRETILIYTGDPTTPQ